MIEKLSPEQEAQMGVYVKKYLALGLSTQPFTEEIEARITNDIMPRIYKAGGLTPPTEVLFFESPLAALQEASRMSGRPVSEEVGNLSYGSQDAGWCSYYKFFEEQCGVDLGTDFALADLCGLCSFWLAYDGVALVSQNPSAIRMENGVLHNVTGPSWEYADGFRGYTLFGTPVSEEVVTEMLPDKKNGGKRILALTNVEERLVAIKAYGAENMLEQMNGKVIDTKKGTIRAGDSRAEYVLHEVVLEGNPEKLLEMQNPSEPKRHYEWVDPKCTSVNEALAWRAGWSVEEFQEPVAKT
jgi:hypothetical protein